METIVSDYVGEVLEPFLDPRKRVFVGYLILSVLIALGLIVVAEKTRLNGAIKQLFARVVWWSPSAKSDYKTLLINQAVMMGVAPRLVSKLAVATFVFEGLHVWFEGRVIILDEVPGWAIAILFTTCLFVLDDLAKYLIHRAMHRWSVLWCFHKVHHTAETLTPITVYRTHPVEGVIFALRGIMVQGLTIASFIYFFGSHVELVTVLGSNMFLFAFNAAGANLRHSHIWLAYGPKLERILISPAQHQIHHSVDVAHHDRNFGAVLAIWDWIGGSLCLAGHRRSLKFGTPGQGCNAHNLTTIYALPFIDAGRCVTRFLVNQFRRRPMPLPLNIQKSSFFVVLAVVSSVAMLASDKAWSDETLNIYSHRQPFLIQPFIDAYAAKTGTKINIVYASKGLAQRLQAEGGRSPADVILTVDIARLYVYADKDLLAPVDSSVLRKNIPGHLRDPKDRWFAFSKRARVIAVSREARDLSSISRYEDLADPRWSGRICSRPGSHVYNRALVASLINALGYEKAEAWAKGVVDNLARRPQGNDRAQVKAIYEGVCDIAIINNYYFGKLKHSNKSDQREWAAAVRLVFPNQDDRGTHINISGGGVAKHSNNKAEAVSFLEFLTTKTAQDLYGEVNFEYPVNRDVPIPSELASWGTFVEDRMAIARIAELAPDAQKIIDRVRW
ncbi:MAG: hypothetical protein CMM47_01910 [Rhodospirillaceae bacterium]|nr:hypothetical protein [Rhodospirillaceae bacterium]